MGDKTGIEWTDATWNPMTGCTKVSPGCDHCYAESIATRFAGTKAYPNGFDLTLKPEKLDQPLRWKTPRRVFVNSMSDLFHKDVPDEYIAQVFSVMAANYEHDRPTHTFQVLTKRPGRMRSLLNSHTFRDQVARYAARRTDEDHADQAYDAISRHHWPLPNVWLGVSVEDQKWADVRIPLLLDTPAAVRFISAEPLLGPVDLHANDDGMHHWLPDFGPEYEDGGEWSDGGEPVCQAHGIANCFQGCTFLDWVIVGGESGRGARPMHADWARTLRDQCTAAGVAFLFKQWGSHDEQGVPMSKHSAGRDLDGRTWDEYPERQAVTA